MKEQLSLNSINKQIILMIACFLLGCEKKSEIDAMYESLDYESPDSSYTAGFDIADGPDYTATQGLFDSNFYCVVLRQPVHGNGKGPTSFRRKDGIVLTDIGGDSYNIPKPGIYTISEVAGKPTLVLVTDFKVFPSRIQDFINRKVEQDAPAE